MIRWYNCRACGKRYSVVYESYNDKDVQYCYYCGKKELKRLYKTEIYKENKIRDIEGIVCKKKII